MKLVILDYSNSQVRIIDNCPADWKHENVEKLDDYMFGEEYLDLNPDTCYYMCGEGIEVTNETYIPKDGKMPAMIDFTQKKVQLHNEMLLSIKKLMSETAQTNLDLSKAKNNDEICRSAYIVRMLDGCEVEEVEVMNIKLENESLFYMAKGQDGEDEDWQDLTSLDVTLGSLDMLYDAVYNKIKEEIEK